MHNETLNGINQPDDKYKEIREVLCKFQEGYTERNLEKVDAFIDELFVKRQDTYVVGTGTGELFLGIDQVKELIQGDWEEWGDMRLDLENARIELDGQVAWFAAAGSVKYVFEDTLEKYDRHVNYINNVIQEVGLTPKQKISFINWFLSLVYHKREEQKREYLWPMRLSGVLLKEAGSWKFSHLKFSMTKESYPDERFENSEEHLELYNQRNSDADKYKNNMMNEGLKNLLKGFETEFFKQKKISKELVIRYFGKESNAYIIGVDNQFYEGNEQVQQFFTANNEGSLSLNLDHAIASEAGGVTWVTVTGLLKQELTEDQLVKRALEELTSLLCGELTSKEKIFAVHRRVAGALKEGASGTSYTWPIRMDAVISKDKVFQQLHFSFPFYWIIEGKVDSL